MVLKAMTATRMLRALTLDLEDISALVTKDLLEMEGLAQVRLRKCRPVLCFAALHFTLLCFAPLRSAVLPSAVLPSAVLYCAVLC